jgi:hypothetical protein
VLNVEVGGLRCNGSGRNSEESEEDGRKLHTDAALRKMRRGRSRREQDQKKELILGTCVFILTV